MFDSGPAHRFVSEAWPSQVTAVSSLPGGVSGVIGSLHSVDLLSGWLTNQAFALQFGTGPSGLQTVFLPAN